VQLLRLRDTQLASALLGNSLPLYLPNLGKLEIGHIDWWLEWMMGVNSANRGDWFRNQLGELFALHLNREVQDRFVAEFNKSGSKFRRLLLYFVLPHRNDITIEVFSR